MMQPSINNDLVEDKMDDSVYSYHMICNGGILSDEHNINMEFHDFMQNIM